MYKKAKKNMNGKELLIMIEKKRVVQGSDTIKNQRGKFFKCRRCRERMKAKYLLDYRTT